MRSRPCTVLTALLAALAVLAGCSPTGGSGGADGGDDPPGTTELAAVFDDVRHLAPRHAVRVADVRVGTVTGIELDGFQARVTLRIDPEHRVPDGTTAAIRQSSLLGENFVELRYPTDMDVTTAPALRDGDVIDDTTTVVELEDLARRATEVVTAISAADVDAILETAVEGIGGRGEEIGDLVTRVADLSSAYAQRSDDVGAVLDGLAELGEDLVEGRDDIAEAIDEAERAAGTAVRQRDRTLAALEGITDLASSTDEVLLLPNAQRLTDLVEDLRPVTARLAGERDRLRSLIVNLEGFTAALPPAVPDDMLQVFSQVRSPSGFEQPVVDLLALLLALGEAGAP